MQVGQNSQGNLKRVVAIHDLSGYGRCSLTVILPTLSVMGVQVCPVPTAVLSTHTGGLGEVCMRDLTDYTIPTLEHYKQLKIGFDCIYSGFLISMEQIDHCLSFFQAYPNALKVVDPVMGDHGKPYKSCSEAFCKRMSELVEKADVISPNLTESCMLLNEKCPISPISASEAKSMLVRLSKLGPKVVVITSVFLADGAMCNIGYDSEQGMFWRVNCEQIPVNYPGTGDIFASVLVGGLMKDESLPIAMSRATEFIELAIKTTYSYGTDPRGGVMLEACLSWLTTHSTRNNFTNL